MKGAGYFAVAPHAGAAEEKTDNSEAYSSPTANAATVDSFSGSAALRKKIDRSENPLGGGAGAFVLPPAKASVPGKPSGSKSPSPAYFTMAGSLALVLGVFCVMIWLTRRTRPQANAKLPAEAVQVLGRAPLTGKQQLQLIRFGNKLILAAVTLDKAETLAEITSADEVDRLCGLCQQTQVGSSSADFRKVLSELGAAPTAKGFTDAAR